eukprot:Pgem_evm1s4262
MYKLVILFYVINFKHNNELIVNAKIVQHTAQDEKLPILHIITPTYYRDLQRAELTRFSNTISAIHDGRVHWIIVEDANHISQSVEEIVSSTKSEFKTHISVPTTNICIKDKYCHKGVNQRNRALEKVKEFSNKHGYNGIVYYADDDNSYDLNLFDTMRKIAFGKVMMWPVGLVAGLKYEGPLCKNGKLIRFHSGWKAEERAFPVDMASFAFHASFLDRDHPPYFRIETEGGFLETNFLEQLVKNTSNLELPYDCKKVMVWHTQTKLPSLHFENQFPSDSN